MEAGSLDGDSTACSLEAWGAGSSDADGNAVASVDVKPSFFKLIFEVFCSSRRGKALADTRDKQHVDGHFLRQKQESKRFGW